MTSHTLAPVPVPRFQLDYIVSRLLRYVFALLILSAFSVAWAAAPQGAKGGAYDCRADSLLLRAATAPLADTSGWAERIDALRPEWRLSSEQEIACRFPLAEGAEPSMFYPEWGSGRAWWILPGDFDGDGREDRLALLTHRDNAARDLLVAFLADGTAVDFASPGGWGFEVWPLRGDTLHSCCDDVPPVVLAADAVTLIAWEASSVAYYLQDGQVRSVATSD